MSGKDERHRAAHTVTDENRPPETKLAAKPGEVVGEAGDRIALFGCVARAVATQIHRHHAMRVAEVRKLWHQSAVVAAPAVHKQDGRLTYPPSPQRTG